MKQSIIIVAALVVVLFAVAYVFMARNVRIPFVPFPQACTTEAKMCPDGSAVGRTGPNCEFAACPETPSDESSVVSGTKVMVMAKLGKSVEALGETIEPLKVLQDSRCPVDVQCIWAGTVQVEVRVVGGMGSGTLALELGKPGTTEVNAITLIDVKPASRSTVDIAESDYIFTFEVIRR
jgi:hypothetical protein